MAQKGAHRSHRPEEESHQASGFRKHISSGHNTHPGHSDYYYISHPWHGTGRKRKGRTGGQPEEEAIGGGVDARAVREDGGKIQRVLQHVGQVLELGQQPGRRVGDHDAYFGETPKVAVCAHA